jgi:HSP20 family protein
LTVEDGALTLRGEKPGPALDEKSRMLFQEIRNGKFERVFTLPESVDAGRMKAAFRNGVLEITIPAAAREAVRTIPIEVRGEAGGKSKAA